jgi:phage FluMu gp28-like protein
MQHQKDWLADTSDLKLAEKGRRTGITYAEALDDTLIAASARNAGGQNSFYIGDTKDKGREFIGYVAHFAKVVMKELSTIEEFLFEDKSADGKSKFIQAYRVQFASGFRVEALSSRPANIRGLQGIVVIDEAAFHRDVREVIDAVNALLIWGGKVRVISTHFGVLNPFNELVREAVAKKNSFRVHHIPFALAVINGLFKRVCLITGKVWTPEAEIAWEAKIRGAYGTRTAAMAQELDCIPSEQEGAALTRVLIESRMEPAPIVRLTLPDAFKNLPDDVRSTQIKDWLATQVLPHLKKLNPMRCHVAGQDFARKADVSALKFFEIGVDLKRRTALLIEMRNVPFDQQREILYYTFDRVPRFGGAALDAGGNGSYLAEKAKQRYGEHVHEVVFSTAWYRLNAIPYIEAFSDGTVTLARDEDVLRDHQSLAYVNGICKVPDDTRFKGADGLDRHGDTAIAGMLAFYASNQDIAFYDYQSLTSLNDGDDESADPIGRDVVTTHGVGNMRGAYG